MTTDPQAWLDEWRTFLEARAQSLPRLLNAGGCREAWLQGEAFLHFTRDDVVKRGFGEFYTECTAIDTHSGRPVKVDFASYSSREPDATTRFVAELKVLGERGFHSKVATGGALTPLQRDPCVHLARRDVDRGWGVVHDYFRLSDCIADVRLLILVVRRDPYPDPLGNVLRTIKFDAQEALLSDTPDLWVKAWSLPPTRGVRT